MIDTTTALGGLFGPDYKDELVGYGSQESAFDAHGGDIALLLALVVIFPTVVTVFFIKDRD